MWTESNRHRNNWHLIKKFSRLTRDT